MRVLVTGAGGLIGTHLVPLLEVEHEVFTISAKSGKKNNIDIDLSKEWSTDVLPPGIDIIIHLAQSEDFKNFPDKATDIFYVNTLSTLKLAGFACANGVKKIIYASSGGIYGSGEGSFSEEKEIVFDPAMGFYLSTKHCSEVILDNYSSLLDVVQLRFFFVYGKEQRKDMLMPRLVNAVREGRPVNLAGPDGIKINPVHASDAAGALYASLWLKGSHKINIGGSEILSMREIGEAIGTLTGRSPQFIIDKEMKPLNLVGNISKMKALLISPVVKFQDGIRTLI